MVSASQHTAFRNDSRRQAAHEDGSCAAGGVTELLRSVLVQLGVPGSALDERRLRSAAQALRHLTQGYGRRPEEIIGDALFDEAGGEPVVVRDIPFLSMCDEHLIPFHGHAHVAYLPGRRVVGLSKLARLVDLYAYRLQSPTRLADDIARAVLDGLAAKGVAIRIHARLGCPGTSGTVMSRADLGAFKAPSWRPWLEGLR